MVVSPHADASDGGPPGRPRAVGLVLALAVGLVVAAIWLLAGRGETPDSVAAHPQGADGAAGSEARSPTHGDAAPELVLPDSTPTGAAPLQAVPAPVAEAWRDIRGVTVRASDGSPVWSATVIAV